MTLKFQGSTPFGFKYDIGDNVKKKSGSFWQGEVVGFYSTKQTPEGYCVQLPTPEGNGPTQIYPAEALCYWEPTGDDPYV